MRRLSSFPSLPSVKKENFCAIGLDVGGTKIAAGLLLIGERRALARRTIPTQADRGGRAVLDDVIQLSHGLGAEAAALGHPVEAIGVGVCELVDRQGNLASSNCIHWLDEPILEELSGIAPAVIEADVRAAALAEALLGAGQPFRCFLYVTVGTGISCCLMLDGSPHVGARGATGTMASSSLSVPCERCGHISRRTLEDIASGPALVARFNAAVGGASSGQDVLDTAIKGDPSAEEIVHSAAEALGSQVGLLVNVLDPEAVIVGGGLGLSDGPYWDHLLVSTRRHIWSRLHRDLPILRAATGVDAGWMGAAMSAHRQFNAKGT